MSITYATLNPSDKASNVTLSNGNLTAATSSSAWGVARSTIGKSSGKWYWEYTFTSGAASFLVGVANSSASLTTYVGGDANGWGYYKGGNKYNNNTNSAYGATYAQGDVIGVALDMDGGTITMYKNNVSQGTMYTGLTGTLYAAVSQDLTGQTITCNFGASLMTYTAPSGYNQGLYTAGSSLEAGLVAYYKLDESSGDASDATGGGNTLTNNTGATTYVSSKINNGALFNNTSTKYLWINNSLTFTSTGTRTWSCWVNVSSFAADGYILDNLMSDTSKRFILYSGSDSKIHMFANGNEVTTGVLSTGTWYFVTCTQNGSTFELFLNGTSQGTTTLGGLSYTTSKFWVGQSYATGGNGRSTIDEIGLWRRKLTSSEITQLYNSGSGLQYPFTVTTQSYGALLLRRRR